MAAQVRDFFDTVMSVRGRPFASRRAGPLNRPLLITCRKALLEEALMTKHHVFASLFLGVCLCSSFQAANANLPNAPIYGPNGAPGMFPNPSGHCRFTVQPGETVTVNYQIGGWYEIVLCIYDDAGRRLHEVGNHREKTGRNTHAFRWTNNAGYPVSFNLMCWNKLSPPNAKNPFLSSRQRVFDVRPGMTVVGFEDSDTRHPQAYQDAIVTIRGLR